MRAWNVVDELLKLGYKTQTALGAAVGRKQGSVQDWKRQNMVPAPMQVAILHDARDNGLPVTPLSFFPPNMRCGSHDLSPLDNRIDVITEEIDEAAALIRDVGDPDNASDAFDTWCLKQSERDLILALKADLTGDTSHPPRAPEWWRENWCDFF